MLKGNGNIRNKHKLAGTQQQQQNYSNWKT